MARDPHAVSVDQGLSTSPYRFPDIDYNLQYIPIFVNRLYIDVL